MSSDGSTPRVSVRSRHRSPADGASPVSSPHRHRKHYHADTSLTNGQIPSANNDDLEDMNVSLNALTRGRIPDSFEIEEDSLGNSPPSISAVPSIECGSGVWESPPSEHSVSLSEVNGASRVGQVNEVECTLQEASTSVCDRTDMSTEEGTPPPLPPRKYKMRGHKLDLLDCDGGQPPSPPTRIITSDSKVNSDTPARPTTPVVDLAELQVPGGFPPRENQASFDSMEAFAGSQENIAVSRNKVNTSSSGSEPQRGASEASSQSVHERDHTVGQGDSTAHTDSVTISVTTSGADVTVTTITDQHSHPPALEVTMSPESSPRESLSGGSVSRGADVSIGSLPVGEPTGAHIVVTAQAIEQRTASQVAGTPGPLLCTPVVTDSGEPFTSSTAGVPATAQTVEPVPSSVVHAMVAQTESVVHPPQNVPKTISRASSLPSHESSNTSVHSPGLTESHSLPMSVARSDSSDSHGSVGSDRSGDITSGGNLGMMTRQARTRRQTSGEERNSDPVTPPPPPPRLPPPRVPPRDRAAPAPAPRNTAPPALLPRQPLSPEPSHTPRHAAIQNTLNRWQQQQQQQQNGTSPGCSLEAAVQQSDVWQRHNENQPRRENQQISQPGEAATPTHFPLSVLEPPQASTAGKIT